MQEPAAKNFDITEHELKRRSVGGSLSLMTAQICKFLLQIATAIVLSRLVPPEEFGLFAIIFAVINFFGIFKDGGLSLATVQAETLSSRQLGTLFWLNAALGLVLTVIAIPASWMTAVIFGDPRLFAVGSVLGVTFLFIGLTAQPRALLRRQMRFTRLAAIEVASIFIGSLAGIIAGWNNAGIGALVCMALVTEVTGWLLLLYGQADWRPRLEFDWKKTRSLVSFGGYLTVFELIGYLQFSFDNLLIGWFWGGAVLSFYDRAFQLLLIPLNQLTVPLGRVVHSTLSRLQDQPERFRKYFYRYSLLFAGIGMPLVVFVYGTAETLIPFLLGENWLPSAALFKALAPAAFCMTISPGVGWLYISLGRARRQLVWHLGIITVWLAVLTAVVSSGTLAVAVAFSVMRALTLIPTLIYASYRTPVTWLAILQNVSLPAFASFASLAMMWLGARYLTAPDDRNLQLVSQGLIYFTVYLSIWMVIPAGRKFVIEGLQQFKIALREPVS